MVDILRLNIALIVQDFRMLVLAASTFYGAGWHFGVIIVSNLQGIPTHQSISCLNSACKTCKGSMFMGR